MLANIYGENYTNQDRLKKKITFCAASKIGHKRIMVPQTPKVQVN